MLMGRRAEQWLTRMRLQSLLPAIAAPAAIMDLGHDPVSVLGAPGLRWSGMALRSEPLTAFAREMRLVRLNQRHPPLPDPGNLLWQGLALDVWAMLVDGHTVVARRTDVFDRLIRCGVVVEMRSLREEHIARAWAETWGDDHLDLREALRRRTRLIARCAPGPVDGIPRLHVWDDGPYRAGAWR